MGKRCKKKGQGLLHPQRSLQQTGSDLQTDLKLYNLGLFQRAGQRLLSQQKVPLQLYQTLEDSEIGPNLLFPIDLHLDQLQLQQQQQALQQLQLQLLLQPQPLQQPRQLRELLQLLLQPQLPQQLGAQQLPLDERQDLQPGLQLQNP